VIASNRQKKVLRFFGIQFSPEISVGAAGWEVGALMESDANREQWRKYLFLTEDFDSDSDALKPFDRQALDAVVVPDGWNAADAEDHFRKETAVGEMVDGSPFDNPQPPVEFKGKRFMFTGKFEFGSREACQAMVIERGGFAPTPKSVSSDIDYLVIGSEGSKTWKRGSYGNKIESAILARRQHGSPAIISEDHWASALNHPTR